MVLPRVLWQLLPVFWWVLLVLWWRPLVIGWLPEALWRLGALADPAGALAERAGGQAVGVSARGSSARPWLKDSRSAATAPRRGRIEKRADERLIKSRPADAVWVAGVAPLLW